VAAVNSPGGSSAAPDRTHYNVLNSYLAGNRKLTGTGTGARVEFADIGPSFLAMSDTAVVDAPIVLEPDSTKPNCLYPVSGSEAAKVGAGLFTKPAA
jgi:hypothetical protein